jgi:hypothetical protein
MGTLPLTIAKTGYLCMVKTPKLDKDDLVAKPVHNILDQLLKAKTAEGFKPKLYVYEDFGMRRA